ncbi:hypothetical protein DSECCO2_471920 [anaerobic digester metagenome]
MVSLAGTRSTSMPTTMHWEPKASAPSVMMCGVFTAAELTEIFSAPARSTSRMSATVEMPPPTEKGMKIWEATASTTLSMMPRPSWEAVMS